MSTFFHLYDGHNEGEMKFGELCFYRLAGQPHPVLNEVVTKCQPANFKLRPQR